MECIKMENNKNPKETFSLRSLMKEITGLTPMDDIFEAEYAKLRRIVKAMNQSLGNNENVGSIPISIKDSFVVITKKLYEELRYDQTGDFIGLFNRMKNNHQLTEKELDMLIDWFKEAMQANPETEAHKNTIALIEAEENYHKIADEVYSVFKNDMELINKITNIPLREQLVKQYLSLLKENHLLTKWRNQLYGALENEYFQREITIIAEEKGLDVEEVLNGTNQELFEIVVGEMIKRDTAMLVKQIEETDSI